MSGSAGVAISTTGDQHRLEFLETCVVNWYAALPDGAAIFVTVDGDEAALERVERQVGLICTVLRVGQPTPLWVGPGVRNGRLGVAANKNTGIEALMNAGADESGYPTVEHLFLCDDDTWPLTSRAVWNHIEDADDMPHSMVCWGKGRKPRIGIYRGVSYASWSWPRGVLLYTHRDVIVAVGGMDERFGPGGHEHAEWSRRIHQAGFTPAPFVTPAVYARGSSRGAAHGASNFWNCEDMIRPGEQAGSHQSRRRSNTTVRRVSGDWSMIERIMQERDGDTSFVAFRAHGNGRESATLSVNPSSRGAVDGDQTRAEEPRDAR